MVVCRDLVYVDVVKFRVFEFGFVVLVVVFEGYFLKGVCCFFKFLC